MNNNYTAAIKARISRRSYLTTEISPNKLAALHKKIEELNAESGLNISWCTHGADAMAGGKSYGMFSGVRAMLLLKGSSSLPHLREKIGYYGEILMLEATALGLGSCWVGGTFQKAALSVPQDEELVCVVPIGNVPNTSTLKEKLLRGVVHRKSKTVEQLLNTDSPISPQLRHAMELVQQAPTARNSQKVSFTLKEGVISAHVPDDYYLDLVDLGICKLHFECGLKGKFELGNGGKFVTHENSSL